MDRQIQLKIGSTNQQSTDLPIYQFNNLTIKQSNEQTI